MSPAERALVNAVQRLAENEIADSVGTVRLAWRDVKVAAAALLAEAEGEEELRPIPGFAFPSPEMVEAIKRRKRQETAETAESRSHAVTVERVDELATCTCPHCGRVSAPGEAHTCAPQDHDAEMFRRGWDAAMEDSAAPGEAVSVAGLRIEDALDTLMFDLQDAAIVLAGAPLDSPLRTSAERARDGKVRAIHAEVQRRVAAARGEVVGTGVLDVGVGDPLVVRNVVVPTPIEEAVKMCDKPIHVDLVRRRCSGARRGGARHE